MRSGHWQAPRSMATRRERTAGLPPAESRAGVACVGAGDDAIDRPPQFRYIAVLVLAFAVVVFEIAAPSADWSRAVAIAIEGLALVVTVATSRAHSSVRRRRAAAIGSTTIVVVTLIAVGVAPRWFTAAFAAVVTAAIPVALVRGLLRLMVERGVTVEAVAGAVAIYLTLGLIFSWVIAFVAQLGGSTPYFAQHTNGSQGDKVYFSFTVLTTTGFGDFTPATSLGHAIAVIEMLTGQLYLVTVIGLLVGNFAARRRPQ
jgi:hypothetical protein